MIKHRLCANKLVYPTAGGSFAYYTLTMSIIALPLHANYVYNRTPMRRLNWKTPSEAIDKEKPDLSHLRILGCGAYVFIPEEVRKNKLSPKSELMDIVVTTLI